MNEAAIVVYKNEVLLSASLGEPGHVEFNFDEVWRVHKEMPLDLKELKWIHCHPIGCKPIYSHTDLNCARGLKLAFGEIGSFGIISFKYVGYWNLSFDCEWYVLDGNNNLVKSEDRYIREKWICLLKTLAILGSRKNGD